MAKKEVILVIPDLHCPFHHPDAIDFIRHLAITYCPTKVLNLGDELDLHCYSYHEKDNDRMLSPVKEFEEGAAALLEISDVIPKMTILESNHGSLVHRKAKTMGIPNQFIVPLLELMDAPKGWNHEFDITWKLSNGTYLYAHHGKSKNAIKAASGMGMNYIQGHYHGDFAINHWRYHDTPMWAITSGCLIDEKSYAMKYAKNNLPKAILGATLIVDSQPILIPMILNKRGRWVRRTYALT